MSPHFIVLFSRFQSGDLDVPDSPAVPIAEVVPAWSESMERQLSQAAALASLPGWNKSPASFADAPSHPRPLRAGDYLLTPHRQLHRLDRAGILHLMRGAKCGDCPSQALLPKLVRDWWEDRAAAVAECLYCGSRGPRIAVRGDTEADQRRACLTAVWRTSRR